MKKNIVVIGASRGIGFETVKILSQHHHVLALSRNIEKLAILESKYGVKIGQLDLTADNVRTELSVQIAKHFSKVDILINNAGYLVNKPLLEITREDIKNTYETNVYGLIESCLAVIPAMKNSGHIVNIGSVGGVQGSVKFQGIGVYSSSKAAVAGFTECLAEELKDTDIQVNCLALGAVQTEMLAEAFPGYEARTSANQMATYITDFALNSNKWINGKIIQVSKSTP